MSERLQRIANSCLQEAHREYAASIYDFRTGNHEKFLGHLDAVIQHMKDARAVLRASRDEKTEEIEPQREMRP